MQFDLKCNIFSEDALWFTCLYLLQLLQAIKLMILEYECVCVYI